MAVGAGVVVAVVVVVAGYIGYRIYFHGPGALHRMTVSAPAATIQYGAAVQQVADLRVFGGARVVHGRGLPAR